MNEELIEIAVKFAIISPVFWFLYKMTKIISPEAYARRDGKPTPWWEWFTL